MHTEELQHVDQNKRIALYKRTDTKSMVWHARFRIEGQTKYKRLSTKRADFDEASFDTRRMSVSFGSIKACQKIGALILTLRTIGS